LDNTSDIIAAMDDQVTRKSRVRPNSDGRREEIVAAALKVMIENGVHHTTTRKMAEAAGVNVATLHYHFHDKEEIVFSAMELLAKNYRGVLTARFNAPQRLHDRIADLLWFIWDEVEKARGEQLVLQEMALYVLRFPHAEHLAAKKESEIRSLYTDFLRAASDVTASDRAWIEELTNFIYACFVGILNQWLVTQDVTRPRKATEQLIVAAQQMAASRRK
jgi:AcrR family transcriptional regulator